MPMEMFTANRLSWKQNTGVLKYFSRNHVFNDSDGASKIKATPLQSSIWMLLKLVSQPLWKLSGCFLPSLTLDPST
jgi:hypothetical protein